MWDMSALASYSSLLLLHLLEILVIFIVSVATLCRATIKHAPLVPCGDLVSNGGVYYFWKDLLDLEGRDILI